MPDAQRPFGLSFPWPERLSGIAMADQPQVTCVADVGAMLGEGPVWVAREAALYWVDIKGRKIFRRGADLPPWIRTRRGSARARIP